MSRSSETITLVVFLVLSMIPAVDAEPTESRWPQFRGPNASGVALQGRYPSQFGPGKNLRWKTTLPRGVSSPCIWGERIFLTSYIKQEETLETLCLDRTNGAILWRNPAPTEKIERVHEVSSPANATPATDGKRVYVYFASYGLLCYDFSGHLVWQIPLPLVKVFFGSGTSPIVVGNTVLLNRDGGGRWRKTDKGEWVQEPSDSHLLAVSASDGKPVWKTPRPPNGRAYATPVLWRHGDRDQILLLGGSRLAAFGLADGKELWWVDGVPRQACGTPILVDDRVFLSATGVYGEPENFVAIPPFEEFIKHHDANKDGFIAVEEIPKELLIVDRRASGGAGNSPLLQFARRSDRNEDKKITKDEWEGFRKRMADFRSSVQPTAYGIRLGGEGDVTKTHVDWKVTRGVPEVPSLLGYRNRLYLVRNGGIVHCRVASSGREIFKGRLGASGGYYASPVAGDGKIYFASDRGVITVLAAGAQLNVLARNDLGERIMATPALVDNTVYVRTDDYLYAFSEEQ